MTAENHLNPVQEQTTDYTSRRRTPEEIRELKSSLRKRALKWAAATAVALGTVYTAVEWNEDNITDSTELAQEAENALIDKLNLEGGTYLEGSLTITGNVRTTPEVIDPNDRLGGDIASRTNIVFDRPEVVQFIDPIKITDEDGRTWFGITTDPEGKIESDSMMWASADAVAGRIPVGHYQQFEAGQPPLAAAAEFWQQ